MNSTRLVMFLCAVTLSPLACKTSSSQDAGVKSTSSVTAGKKGACALVDLRTKETFSDPAYCKDVAAAASCNFQIFTSTPREPTSVKFFQGQTCREVTQNIGPTTNDGGNDEGACLLTCLTTTSTDATYNKNVCIAKSCDAVDDSDQKECNGSSKGQIIGKKALNTSCDEYNRLYHANDGTR